MSAPVTARTALAQRRFWWHFVEMVLAMVVGMAVGMMLVMMVWTGLAERTETYALVMAGTMSIGMAVWMRVRRHGWAAIAEMVAAMFASFVVLFPLLWLGWLSGDALIGIGHVLMLPAMVLTMLRRPQEYAS